MLTEKELKEIGKAEAREMFGEEFFDKNKENACACYGMTEGIYEYNIGMSSIEKLSEYEMLPMGDETPYDYYAFVEINPGTGKVTRVYEESILPK